MTGADEFNEPEPRFDEDYSNIIIVDGIPKIPMKKISKLTSFLKKTFAAYGSIVDIDIPGPDDPSKPKAKTPGYCFIEYSTKEMAAAAMKSKNGKPLDAKHTVMINLMSQYDKLSSASQDYMPPPASEYKSESKNFDGWQLDDFGRDQLAIRFAKETHICWNDPIRRNNEQEKGLEMYYDGNRQKQGRRKGGCWTESYIAWSPKGTYLATFHDQGILLWGGPEFEEVARFEHRGVSAIDFSPCEKFLVTANWRDKKSDRDPDCFIVWDIQKKKSALQRPTADGVVLKRGFNKEKSNSWPAFKWSHDDKYFARVGQGVVSVYETPSFSLLTDPTTGKKKSIKVPKIQDIAFSPKTNIMSYWVPEVNNQPASVVLMDIPSRKIVRQKHLYSVNQVSMHWQSVGDYLAVKLQRRKSKKTFTTNFEIFRLREKNIPVEVIELDDPVVTSFAWEPRGHMFGVVHMERPQGKPLMSFYQIKKKKTVLLHSLTDRHATSIHWSPSNHYAVLMSMQSGKLEFYDVKKNESIAEAEHFKCTSVEWDPTGRYLVSISAQPLGEQSWAYASENGYKIWTFQGENLVTVAKETLYQVMWRPRPESMLTSKQKSEVKKNLRKTYWDKFEQEMLKIKQSTSSAASRERLRIKEEWKKYRKQCDQDYVADASLRKELRGDIDSDNEDDWEVVESTVQTVISITEEALE